MSLEFPSGDFDRWLAAERDDLLPTLSRVTSAVACDDFAPGVTVGPPNDRARMCSRCRRAESAHAYRGE